MILTDSTQLLIGKYLLVYSTYQLPLKKDKDEMADSLETLGSDAPRDRSVPNAPESILRPNT